MTDISKTQAEFLMSTTLDSLDKGKELVSDIVAAWHTGNTTVSEQLLLRGLARKAELLEFIVTERNALWVPQL